MQKLKVSQVMIVEGKYDKIKLSSVVDGVIICTNGFQIYNDFDTVSLIRKYAETKGIIILTDSDSAGFQIRNHLKSIISEGRITNLYIPEIFGKEKRKSAPSKEGKLGVEGIDAQLIREVFERSGVLDNTDPDREVLTRSDMYKLGLSGKHDSSALRKKLCQKLELPLNLSAKALLEYLNTAFSKEKATELIIGLTDE